MTAAEMRKTRGEDVCRLAEATFSIRSLTRLLTRRRIGPKLNGQADARYVAVRICSSSKKKA